MKKNQRRFPVIDRKRVFIFFISVIFVIALYQAAQIIKDSDLFKIKEIVFLGVDKKINLRGLLGRNIIKLDLKALSTRITEEFYYVKEAKIARNLPNQLTVRIKKRVPIAKIKLDALHKTEYFYVDMQGMLLNISDFPNHHKFVTIDGLENRLSSPRAGKIYYDSVLHGVLDIIKEKELCKDLATYCIDRISIADQNNITLVIRPEYVSGRYIFPANREIKVEISRDNIREKLVILAKLLERLRDKFEKIIYIDFRFKEPVVKEM